MNGSTELVNHMGTPLTIVNTARVSFGKNSEEMGDREWGLIRYLIRNKHSSPFRHCSFQFRIVAPVFVIRQWQKHQVGCAWNEVSGRYVVFDDCDHWEHQEWRGHSDNLKQGSIGPFDCPEADGVYEDAMRLSWQAYSRLLELGVCREQARTVLPLSLMTQCVWTASLQAVVHFLKLRTDSHAQAEIRVFADGVRTLIESISPDYERLLAIMVDGKEL